MALEVEDGTGKSTAEKLSGIYAIKNRETGKVYIGSAVNIKQRFKSHLAHLRKGNHHSRKLQRSWTKHGEENFSFQPILICEKQDLLFYEQKMIDTYHAATDGYNMNPTAGSHLGAKQSEECKAKVSASKKGIKRGPLSDEWRAAMSAAHKGDHPRHIFTKEDFANRTGCKLSEEHKEKVTKSLKGNKRALGFKHTAETRAKVSAAGIGNKNMLGKKLSEETKRKIGAFSKGKPKSPETRARMSESAKRIWAERRAA